MRNALTCTALLTLTLGGCPTPSQTDDPPDADVLMICHNNTGPMCLAALDWLADVQAAFPGLTVEEHLTYEPGEADQLLRWEALYAESQGVSQSFAYLPIVFYQGQAFSGFDDDVAATLEALLATHAPAPPTARLRRP